MSIKVVAKAALCISHGQADVEIEAEACFAELQYNTVQSLNRLNSDSH